MGCILANANTPPRESSIFLEKKLQFYFIVGAKISLFL
jgi:hypothetical protein